MSGSLIRCRCRACSTYLLVATRIMIALWFSDVQWHSKAYKCIVQTCPLAFASTCFSHLSSPKDAQLCTSALAKTCFATGLEEVHCDSLTVWPAWDKRVSAQNAARPLAVPQKHNSHDIPLT